MLFDPAGFVNRGRFPGAGRAHRGDAEVAETSLAAVSAAPVPCLTA